MHYAKTMSIVMAVCTLPDYFSFEQIIAKNFI